LQAALILTISLPQYLDPVVQNGDDYDNEYSAIVGISALLHVGTIILCTILSATFSMPYNGSDNLVMRVKLDGMLVVANIANYAAAILVIIAMLFAGFARDSTDGYVQLWAIPLIMAVIYCFIVSQQFAIKLQDVRSFLFYKKYCEPNGMLKQQYLDQIYNEEEDPIKAKLEKLLKD
jgi:hypothetical protein